MTAQPRALVDQFAIWNALVASLGAPIALPGPAEARMALAQGDPAHGPVFAVRTLQGDLRVTVERFPFSAVTGAAVNLEDLARLPAPLDAMLTEGLGEILTGHLPDSLRGQIVETRAMTVTDAAPALPGDVECFRIHLQARGWPEPAILTVQAAPAVFAALSATQGARAVVPTLPEALAQMIPVTLRIALRGHSLRLDTLSGLAPGDILLAPAGDAPFLMLGPRLVAGMARTGETWTLTELAVTDHPDLPQPGPAPTAVSLADLPVSLAFVLEERSLTLAEVQSLRPGAVLPFGAITPAAGLRVQVLANGRAIGTGTLVEIDGRPAIRLTQLFGQD